MKKEGHILTSARFTIKEKWRNLPKHLRKPLQGPVDANAPERWEHFKNAVYNTALSTFGKKTKKTADWFDCQPSRIRGEL